MMSTDYELIDQEVVQNLFAKMKAFISRSQEDEYKIVIFTDLLHADKWTTVQNSSVRTEIPMVPIPPGYTSELNWKFQAEINKCIDEYLLLRGENPSRMIYQTGSIDAPQIHVIFCKDDPSDRESSSSIVSTASRPWMGSLTALFGEDCSEFSSSIQSLNTSVRAEQDSGSSPHDVSTMAEFSPLPLDNQSPVVEDLPFDPPNPVQKESSTGERKASDDDAGMSS